jgi:2,3-bisphosphoglycerate-dependent phosphoglycerate mutase
VTATTILLVRHGQTDWNRDRRVQGHSDIPLNETGRAQAAALADELADETIDAVYASDLTRARDTAAAVAATLGLEVQLCPDLREKHFGSWEGLRDDEIRRRFPDARSGHWGDGETREQMTARVLHALRSIAARHAQGTALVVTHGGPLRAVQRELGQPDGGPIVNCHVLRVSVANGRLAAS